MPCLITVEIDNVLLEPHRS